MKRFIIDYYIIHIQFIVIGLALIMSDKVYLVIFKDIANGVVILSFLFFLSLIIIAKSQIKTFISSLIYFIIIFSFVISLYRISIFFYTTSINDVSSRSISEIASIDYNFALLPVFFGIIAIIYLFKPNTTKTQKLFYSLLQVIFSINILSSGSRRGLITLFLIVFLLLAVSILNTFTNNTFIKRFSPGSRNFLLLFLLTLSISGYAIFGTSFGFKRKAFNFFGIQNVMVQRQKISMIAHRYFSIINKTISFESVNDLIWSSKSLSSNDPDSGWGNNISKRVFSITGKNFEMVPSNAIGYYMDNTTNAKTRSGYAYSITEITALYKGDTIRCNEDMYLASVYCYISEDFNGNWARISAEGNVNGIINNNYNLKRKGTWQKLQICFTSTSVIPPVYLYWIKYGTNDFSNLKGNIIFAYPEYKKISKNNFDSRYPYSGWGRRISTEVFPLAGKNVEIVPEDAVGYKMDYTSDARTWDGNSFSVTSITDLFSDSISNYQDNSYIASVYCFLSEDFSGSWARISAEGHAKGNIFGYYDLSEKGTWQHIQINFTSDSILPTVYLFWSNYGYTNFDELSGYVIFAYPKYSKSSQQGRHLTSSNPDLLNESSLVSLPVNLFNTLLFKENTQDPIRDLAARIIAEDSTYYGYSTNLFADTISNKFLSSRIMRWQFAWQIFTKEYNWRKKMFGGGFAHLNWYGFYFSGDKTRSDYPHNPFLSILLYSGVLGLILYLYLMYRVFTIYIKYIKEYYILFIFFCITFFFSFFSAGSPFDPPVMGFFVMLPFLIDYIHKKDRSN